MHWARTSREHHPLSTLNRRDEISPISTRPPAPSNRVPWRRRNLRADAERAMTDDAAKHQFLLPVHRFLIHVVIGADLCYNSRLYLFIFSDAAQRVILSSEIVIAAFYILIAIARGYITVVLISVACICLVLAQLWTFGQNWNVPLNWPGIGQYGAFLSFVPIFIMARDGVATYVVRTLARYAIAYTFLYLAISLLHSVGLLPPQISTPLILNDIERGDRLWSHSGALGFVWYVSLVRVQERTTGAHVMLLLVSAMANIMTLSRVYLGCIVVVSILSVVRASRNAIRAVCLCSFGILSSALVYGMLDTRWNPFFAFASNDTSGLGRALEYQIAQEIIGRSPMLGMGLTSFSNYHFSVTGLTYFSPGDLGLVGVLLDYGLIGLCLFLVSSLITCAYNEYIPKPFDQVLFLQGCTLVLDSTIAPNMFSPQGAFFFLVILGFWLAYQAKSEDIRVRDVRSVRKS